MKQCGLLSEKDNVGLHKAYVSPLCNVVMMSNLDIVRTSSVEETPINWGEGNWDGFLSSTMVK